MKILGIETSCDETAAAVVELSISDIQQPTDVSAGLGTAEQRSKSYTKYDAGVAEAVTPPSTTNNISVSGSARKQDVVVCRLLSNVVASSVNLHVKYGGVVPEIAARSHIESIIPTIDEALDQAKCKWEDVEGIAVTNGAGLGGSLLIGVMTARTLAIIKRKPLYAINHVEGHLYSNFITEQSVKSRGQSSYQLPKQIPGFPMLGLIVSGGHTQLVLFKDHFKYKLLGQTHDDAIGEAFDKVAKILGLPYPGGPSITEAAKKGNPLAYNFPKARSTINQASHVDAMQGNGEQQTEPYTKYGEGVAQLLTPHGASSNSGATSSDGGQAVALRGLGKYDFSFSGIKTAVLRTAQAEIGEDYAFPSHKLPQRLSEAQKANITASFQRIAIETIVDKTVTAYEEFKPKSVIIGGGVAANQELRQQLAKRLPIAIEFQDIKLMGDNGAMVASLGCFKASLKQQLSDPYKLDISPNLSM